MIYVLLCRKNMKPPLLTYKPYIDGLRALAVLAVIFFHLNPELFPGGYLGVDVFFVISGFVISQSLYKNYIQTGSIDILQFYVRRFKRLYPALVVMVGTTSALYVLFGFLWDTNIFIKSSVTSIFAVSNLYYLKHVQDYFHQDLINPLLHTWSLGVEEQFYVVYPLFLFSLLLVAKRLRIRSIYIGLTLLLVSIGLYVLFVLGEGSVFGNFYFPTARFWELGAGCALFFFSLNYKISNFAGIYMVFGLAALMGVQFFQSAVDSIYVETLVTVFATVLIIFSGLQHRSMIVRFLENTKINYIGKRSYSLYLWHLPMIYFCSLYLTPIWYYICALILTIVFATLSYKYIEVPLRNASVIDTVLHRTKYYLVALIFVLVVSGLVIGKPAVVKMVDVSLRVVATNIKKINYIESQFKLGSRIQPSFFSESLDVVNRCATVTTDAHFIQESSRGVCNKGEKSDSLIYIIGDSHAEHFVPMLDVSKVDADIYFSSLSHLLIAEPSNGQFDKNQDITEVVERLKFLNLQYKKIYLVTSMFLSPYQEHEGDMYDNLHTYTTLVSPYATIIFVAPTPVFDAGPELCVVKGLKCSLNKTEDEKRRMTVFNIYQKLAKEDANVYVYDPYAEICSETKCLIYDKNTDFLQYMDDDHLSIEGSSALAPNFDAWFNKTILDK